MVVVVPPLSEGEQRHPPAVSRVVAGREPPRAPHMCGGVDEPGRVEADDDAKEDAPEHERPAAEREQEDAERDERDVVIRVQPAVEGIGCQIGRVLRHDLGVVVVHLAEENPTHVRPEAAVARRVRVEVGVGVLVVDAVNFDREPGFIGVLENRELPALFASKASLHHLGLMDVLAAAQLLEVAPREICLIGIQPLSLELGLELARVRREKAPVGLLMVSIDGLKDINDKYGHMAGDAAIRATARELRASLRPYDAIGRYGGEAFVIIVTGCDSRSSIKQAERFFGVLKGRTVDISQWGKFVSGKDAALPILYSIGVISGTGEHDSETLLKSLEGALRVARSAGGNRIESATPPPPPVAKKK